ncbi:MAG: LuxR family transcriptional regulator [Kordiimonadaceae bacterium]|nr:LuxR family transcriptional regulator [Kordiimonadaceae bacterium]MBO6568992.1 LuxR family transcriptional regulator [Kordiimonadaceae bacterium]MBO6964467.1 LuxR family transcriptional regulator [Kordiimonadaceae bacterium]
MSAEADIEVKVLDFVDRIRELDNVLDLEEEFAALISQYGYIQFRCGQVYQKGSGVQPRLIFGSLADDWSVHYRDQGYMFTDSSLQHGLVSKYPFFWSDQWRRDRVNDASKRMFEEALHDFNLSDGLIVPIHMEDGSVSIVSMMGDKPDTSDEIRRGLGLAAMYLHEKAIKLKDHIKYQPFHDPVKKVTPRQLDCLQWVAEGKSDWEISQILQISESTVHNHVEAAKKNLGVNTRVQAVVAASRRRLFVL